jgi:predicted nucleic acid-binding protein
MILVDSNIPMYLVGASTGHKEGARRALERCLTERERLVTDSEVLQEILHRYAAIQRREAIQPAFDAILGVVDDVLPVRLAEVEKAKSIVLAYSRLSARDSIHLAVMETHGIDQILSFDSGFDGYPGVRRLVS